VDLNSQNLVSNYYSPVPTNKDYLGEFNFEAQFDSNCTRNSVVSTFVIGVQ